MQGRRFDFEYIFRLIVVFGFSLALAVPVIEWLGYRTPGFFILALAAVVFIFFYTSAAFYPLVLLTIPFTITVLAVIYLRNPVLVLDWIAPLLSFPQPANAPFWPLVNLTGITLYFFLFLFRQKTPMLLLLLTGLLSLVPLWYLHIDSAYPAVVFYSLTWFLLLAYRRGSAFWDSMLQGEGEDNKGFNRLGGNDTRAAIRGSWLSFALSVMLLALVATLILPKNIQPLPLYPLQNWVRANIPFAGELRSMEDEEVRGDGSLFDLYSFGFQDSRNLGGPLRLDNTVFLEIEGRGGLYLKGTVSEIYTGSSWEKSFLLTEVEEFAVPEEKLYPLFEEIELKIKHTRLRTKTVFGLLYTLDLSPLPGTLAIGGNSSLAAQDEIPLHYEYAVKGLAPAYRFDFSAHEEEVGEANLEGKGFYLALPSDLPQAVHELAFQVAGEEKSYYSKISALESFLRNSYSYNTDMGALPAGRDFVEYFLLEWQEGYCTHFATALAVMGRVVGVPTRYVSGFVVPPEPDTDDIYRVAGINAHAWVEAYIPGFGWLPFETTPGFPGVTGLPLFRGELIGARAEYDRDILDSWRSGLEDQPFAEHYNDYSSQAAIEDSGQEQSGLAMLLTRVLLAALILLVLGVAAFLVYRLLAIKKYFRDLDQQDSRGRAVGYYLATLALLDKMALGRYPGETPRQYSRRIIRHVHSWTHNFKDLSEGINLALYSRENDKPELAVEAERFFHFTFNSYLATRGKIKALAEIIISARTLKI